MSEKQNLTIAEWRSLGERLFGPDFFQWKFVCPSCGHVQSPEDFRRFKESGATPDSAATQCYGRYLPKNERGGFSKDHANPKVKSPCDYAAYGLFRLSPLEVIHEDGTKAQSFGFYEEAAP
jgi:hypothetical protein